MADALHTESPQDDDSEARRTPTCSQLLRPDESAVLPPREISVQSPQGSSGRFLQPPTFTFTPATPSPPQSHGGLEDSLIKGLLSNESNSLGSSSLDKVSALESNPLGLLNNLGDDAEADSGSLADNSLGKNPSIVDSAVRHNSEGGPSLAGHLDSRPNDVPKSLPASIADSHDHSDVISKGAERSFFVVSPDSLQRLEDGVIGSHASSADTRIETSRVLESQENLPATKANEFVVFKGDRVSTSDKVELKECSNGNLAEFSGANAEMLPLPAKDSAKMSLPEKLGEKFEESSLLSQPREDFAEVSQPEKCLEGTDHDGDICSETELSESHPVNDLASDPPSIPADPFSLHNTVSSHGDQSIPMDTRKSSKGEEDSNRECSNINTNSVHLKKDLCPTKEVKILNEQIDCEPTNVNPDKSEEKVGELRKDQEEEQEVNIYSESVDCKSGEVNQEKSDEKTNELRKDLEAEREIRIHGESIDCDSMETNQEKSDEKASELRKDLEEEAVYWGDEPVQLETEAAKESSHAEGDVSVSDKKMESGEEGAVKASPLLLNDSEPLQPVTIGGSLQPLEEVQEASLLNDPSFTADLSLIDSSADEADSIGGLVINSVIGAADGVADFPLDEEMETDRQLTDISSSAPTVAQDVCDADSGDDDGPSAKRMKLDGGEKDADDKSEDSRKVVFRVVPLKNGHGVWDSLKLKEVLLSKGTIHLRIHASSDEVEQFDSGKSEIEVDFSCILVSAVEEESEQVLGLSGNEPDSDVCDPLDLGSNPVLEHTSSPPYTRPFAPQTRGRSTALQPALPRPPYRQLQSPPRVYNKNELLGLPQPLEFEEPQMGAADWSGADSRSVTSPVLASPNQPPREGGPSLPRSAPNPKQGTEKVTNQEREVDQKTIKKKGVIWRKVCEHCGKEFNKSQQYLFHINSHRPLLKCSVCTFSTKDRRKFNVHEDGHKKANPQEECNVCKARFVSERSVKVHLRRIHGIIRCKDCHEGFEGEEVYANHREQVHNDPTYKKAYISSSISHETAGSNVNGTPQPSSNRSELRCRLCDKQTRNKYQLKIHIAQHLGVTSDQISDEFLGTQDLDSFEYTFQGEETRKCPKPRQSTETVIGEDGQQIYHSTESEPVESYDSIDQVSTQVLNAPVKMEPMDIPFDQSEGLQNEGFPFVPFVREEPTEVTAFQGPSVDPPLDQPSPHNLIAMSVDPSMLDLQQSMLKSLHSMIFPNGNAMTRIPVTSLPSTSHFSPPPCFQDSNRESSGTEKVNNRRRRKKVRSPKPKIKKIKPKLYCNECPGEFSSQKALQRHQIKHKNEELRKYFACPECEITCLSALKLSRHFKAVHKEKLRCRYHCALLFGTQEEVFTHYKKFHKVESPVHSCPHCGIEYLMEGFLLNHLERCTKCPPESRPVHVCGNCQAVLKTRREYNIHITKCVRSKDDDNSSEVSECGRKDVDYREDFEVMDKGQELLKTEMSSSKDLPLEAERKFSYQCKYCKMDFEDMEEGADHCFSSHQESLRYMGAQPHVCHICGVEFKYKLGFCKHLTKHYCELERWDDLVPRNLMELVYAKNYCWICRCTLQGNIYQHLNQRNKKIDFFFLGVSEEPENKSFGCTYCLEHFTHRYDYWKHVKVHLSELTYAEVDPMARNSEDASQPWECSLCLLLFTDTEEFLKHLATHAILCRTVIKSDVDREKGMEEAELECKVREENEDGITCEVRRGGEKENPLVMECETRGEEEGEGMAYEERGEEGEQENIEGRRCEVREGEENKRTACEVRGEENEEEMVCEVREEEEGIAYEVGGEEEDGDGM